MVSNADHHPSSGESEVSTYHDTYETENVNNTAGGSDTAVNSSLPPSSESSANHPVRYSRWAVALIFLVPALGGGNFGYDIGATSFSLVQMQSPLFSGTSWWPAVANSSLLRGAILALASAGAGLVSSIWLLWPKKGYTILGRNFSPDWVSRKRELQIGSVLYIIGALLQMAAGLVFGTSEFAELAIPVLLVGRIVYGMGIGVTMHAAPTYIAEMGPPELRGLLVSLKEAAIVLGILGGYVVGYALAGRAGGWPWIYAVSLIPSILILVLSRYIPRSSRWLLLLNGHRNEALQSVQFIYPDAAVALSELVLIEQGIPVSEEDEAGDNDASLWDPAYRAPLLAGIGLVVLQQVTGQPSVLSYATTIFRNAGWADHAAVLVAVFKLVTTLLAATTVERFGRTRLLLVGCTLMLVALLILTFLLGSASHVAHTGTLVGMFLYIGGYQVGFGPITWLLTSELYPLRIRGPAVALAVQMNFLLNMLVQFSVPILEQAVGLGVTFGVFAGLTAYSLQFVRQYVPETKGKTLEEIEQQFLARRRSRSPDDQRPEEVPLLSDGSNEVEPC